MLILALAALLAAEPTPPTLRLGDAARPARYDAELTIVPTSPAFDGRIAIEVVARETLPVLWLNANGLVLKTARAVHDGREIPARVVNVPKDFVGLAFDPPLPAGTSRVEITYSGTISSTEPGGADRQKDGDDWYVFTQFEAVDARRVFPCFDEPSFKAPWKLALTVRGSDVALGNAPAVAEEVTADGMKRVTFAETKPLPSYTVAFAVGPFDIVDAGKGGAGAPIRIITPRGKAGQARWAAEISEPILRGLETYFGSPYPYEKLDLIAVPLKGGAMENPGLITFGSRLLLSPPESDSIQRRRSLARVTAHEFAHLWFGDLVTMAWWDDLWLNESFASWMEARGVEAWRPDFRVAERRTSRRDFAMSADSLQTARKIRNPIASNDDIENAFDGAITYTKGSQVIRMFERWIGEEAFLKGVRRYLTKHAHGNATVVDFLGAISAEAGQDIAPHFATFLDQPGVPLVSMELQCDAGRAPALQLKQERFLPVGSGRADMASLWHIPVCVRWGNGEARGRACSLLTEREGRMELAGATGCPDWILPNEDGAGYYRASISADRLDALFRDADRTLTVKERIAAVGDLNALVRAGKVPYAEALARIARLARDPDALVVEATLAVTGGLRDGNLVPPAQEAAYARFIRDTYGPRARQLGWRPRDGEDDDTRVLRAELVPVVADEGGDAELQAEARRLADARLVDRSAVAPEMVESVLRVAARSGDRALLDKWLAAVRREPEVTERRRLFVAMGAFRDPDVLQQALAIALKGDFPPRESWAVISGASAPPENHALVYHFIKTHFDTLVAQLPRDTAASFPSYGAAVCQESAIPDVESFFRPRASAFVGLPERLDQSLERLRLCIALGRAQGPSVARFLEGYAAETGSAGSSRLFQSR
jgi:cytosol alanyl aminopeptidase